MEAKSVGAPIVGGTLGERRVAACDARADLVLTCHAATAVGRRSLVKKNNTGGGRGCFGRRPTWDQKQRWMGDECDENPTVNSTPRGLKYSAGHNHDDDLDSVVLVGVVGVLNASSLGRLSLVKSSFDHDLPAT